MLGDKRYGDFPANRAARQRQGLRRMFLHAWRLELPHPITGAPLRPSAAAGGAEEALVARTSLARRRRRAGGRGARGAARPHGER